MEVQELLALVELGGYSNFVPLYQRYGYQVEMVNSVRKAHRPKVVVKVSGMQAALEKLQGATDAG